MIIHADMDAFYASVEIREQPQLAPLPVAVGGSAQGRGVISACNYVARRFGVHSAMPTKTALQKCPSLVLLPGRMSLYHQVSCQITRIFERYTPLIEPLSLDEAFLDVTASEKLFGDACRIGRRIKDDIASELKLVVSIGVAPNKFLAKLASDLEKPDGFVFVNPNRIQAFLDPLPVSRLWGAGKQTQKRLQQMNIHSIADLRHKPRTLLVRHFGKYGDHLWQLAHGRDNRPVETSQQAKSISNEITFARDLNDHEQLMIYLFQLCEKVAWRCRQQHLKGRTLSIKIRDRYFKTISRQISLNHATDDTSEIWTWVKHLFVKNRPPRQWVRLIGVGISHFNDQEIESGPYQPELFDEPAATKQSPKRIDSISDQINSRYGLGTVRRGASVRKRRDR